MSKVVPLPIPETAAWLEYFEDEMYLRLNKEFIALRKRLRGKSEAEIRAGVTAFHAKWGEVLQKELTRAVMEIIRR